MTQLNVEIPDDLQRRLKLRAVTNDLTVRILVIAALTEMLDQLDADAQVNAR